MPESISTHGFLRRLLTTSLWLSGGSALESRAKLESLAHMLVPHFADWCTVDFGGEGGRLERVITVHMDPEKRRLAQELAQRYPPREDAATGPRKVVNTGEPEFVPRVSLELLQSAIQDPEHLALVQNLGLSSYLCVPLRAETMVLGAMTVVRSDAEHPFTDQERDLVVELGVQVGTSIAEARSLGQEISESKRRVRDLKDANERYSEFLESTIFAFLAVDRDWNIVFSNQKVEPLLQKSRAELLGKNLWSEFPEGVNTRFHSMCHRAVDDREPVLFEEFYAPLHRWYQVQAVPTPDHLLVYFYDVTERREFEEAVRHSEERFRAAVEAVGDIIWTNTAEGEMRGEQPYWSEFTGQTSEQYSGHGWAQAVHPDDAPPTLEAWNEAVRQRRMMNVEHRVRRKDGVYRLFSVRAVPVLNEDRQVREWVGVHTDITDRRQREAERQELLQRERVARQQAETERQRAAEATAQLEQQRDELARTNADIERANRDLNAATSELRARQEHQLHITTALRAVNRSGAYLLFKENLDDICNSVIDTLSNAFRAKVAGIWLSTSHSKLKRQAQRGIDEAPTPALAAELDLNFDSYKIAWVARYRRPFVSSNLDNDIQFDQGWLDEHRIASAALFPLLAGERFLGVMALFVEHPLPVEAGEILATLAALLSASLENVISV